MDGYESKRFTLYVLVDLRSNSELLCNRFTEFCNEVLIFVANRWDETLYNAIDETCLHGAGESSTRTHDDH